MDWRDEGTLLSLRKHGETSAIIEVFCAAHGRHAGVVRGGTSRRLAPVLQPGARLDVAWRARLEEHLGAFTVEPLKSRAAAVMDDRDALAGLNAMTALLSFALPEREAHPRLYAASEQMFDLLGNAPAWPVAYLRWELSLLEEMGFGLDLTQCAVTGAHDDLPPELLGVVTDDLAGVPAGLATTGHFLTHGLAASLGNRPLPEARARLVDRLTRGSGVA